MKSQEAIDMNERGRSKTYIRRVSSGRDFQNQPVTDSIVETEEADDEEVN